MLRLFLAPLCLGRRHRAVLSKATAPNRCLLEVCGGSVWVVDAHWGRGVFSEECLLDANLTSVQEPK